MKKTGLLLVNLGTPKSLQLNHIKSYLREFLSDPRVIDIPDLVRFLLVNLIIVPFRSKKTQSIYKEVWISGKGSPLLVYCESLILKLQKRLPETSVKLAMRYQYPSIEDKLEEFKKEGVSEIRIFPMFPQYASATYGSVLDKVYKLASKEWNTPFLKAVAPYYSHESYIKSLTQSCLDGGLKQFSPDVILMSYHGLPERHCTKSSTDVNGCMFSKDCCSKQNIANVNCYRRQCFVNSRLLGESLDLKPEQYQTVFQSQFGKDKWIEPYLEPELEKLAKNGVKKVAVLAPSFTADCIETIEEIGLRAKELFVESGGDDLLLIPCLNDRDDWADAIVEISST